MNQFSSTNPIIDTNKSRNIEFEILGMENQFREENESYLNLKTEDIISFLSHKLFEFIWFLGKLIKRIFQFLFSLLKKKKALPFLKLMLVGYIVYFLFTNKNEYVAIEDGPAVIFSDNERSNLHHEATFEMIPSSFLSSKKSNITPIVSEKDKQQNTKALAYIDRFEVVAKIEMKKFGIPASIKMAQALLETNTGLSKLCRNNNNHFGLKCFSKTCTKDHCTNMSDDHHKDFFRKYNSSWESWRDHSKFLNGQRYIHLQEHGNDYKKWAKGLQKAGYATDKKYSKKLIKLIQKYRLHELDI